MLPSRLLSAALDTSSNDDASMLPGVLLTGNVNANLSSNRDSRSAASRVRDVPAGLAVAVQGEKVRCTGRWLQDVGQSCWINCDISCGVPFVGVVPVFLFTAALTVHAACGVKHVMQANKAPQPQQQQRCVPESAARRCTALPPSGCVTNTRSKQDGTAAVTWKAARLGRGCAMLGSHSFRPFSNLRQAVHGCEVL
jgi:hypothetical protein